MAFIWGLNLTAGMEWDAKRDISSPAFNLVHVQYVQSETSSSKLLRTDIVILMNCCIELQILFI